MRTRESAGIALRALKRHRLRSFLTTLGVMIGVSSLIAMVGVTQGVQQLIADQIAAMGINRIMLSPHMRGGRVAMDLSDIHTITVADAQAIGVECPSVLAATPYARCGAQLVAGSRNWNTLVTGAGADFPRVRNWGTVRGRFFSEDEVTRASKVCVLGQTVALELFGRAEEPVGKVVRVNRIPFQVVGVLESKGQAATGQNLDDTIIPPYTTVMKKMTGAKFLNQIQIAARSGEAIAAATEEIDRLLRQRHGIPEGEEADFSLRTQKDVQQMMDETYDTMMLFLLCVASIALLVGGVGIMNIMLVSVQERIREIGIRMAVGARSAEILAQFLLEAVMLSLVGGAFGVMLGAGAAVSIGASFHWPISLSPVVAVWAFGISGAVGVLFGFLPAWSASRLDPIQALTRPR